MTKSRKILMYRRTVVVIACAVLLGGCGNSGTGESLDISADGELIGTLLIEPAKCETSAPVSGSWFRMIEAGGTTTDGPFVTNFDSLCDDQTFTTLTPGTDGGLRIGSYQPHPAQTFDAASNGTAARIMTPARFYSVTFAIGTAPRDPVTGTVTPAPQVRAIKPTLNPETSTWLLEGNLAAITAAWNNELFHQGSPHPGGAMEGATTRPTGTLDVDTGRYQLSWTSQVESGPFAGFIGKWNLEGTFVPDK